MFEKVDWFSFIVGGIFVSFLVNIISSFTQPKIEKWLESFSASRRLRNNLVKEMFDAEVDKLSNNPHEELIARQKATTRMIVITTMQLNSLICLVAILLITNPLLNRDIFIVLGLSVFNHFALTVFSDYPNTIHSMLREVDKRKNRPIKNLESYVKEKLNNVTK